MTNQVTPSRVGNFMYGATSALSVYAVPLLLNFISRSTVEVSGIMAIATFVNGIMAAVVSSGGKRPGFGGAALLTTAGVVAATMSLTPMAQP